MKNKTEKNIKKCRKIKEIVTDVLDIPEEILNNMTKISVIGNKKIKIEGYKQIVEFSRNNIEVKANDINIQILGQKLDIKEMLDQELNIIGEIEEILYKK